MARRGMVCMTECIIVTIVRRHPSIDEYPAGAPMAHIEIDTVLLKVASRCNLNCGYCYIYNMGDQSWTSMPKIMSFATVSQIAEQLADLASCQESVFAVVLHGGEPLMIGPQRLSKYLCTLRSRLPAEFLLCIQTNGILITREILDICERHKTTISISIDGPQWLNDKWRRDLKNRGTHTRTLEAIELLANHPSSSNLFTGVLAVVDPTSDPREVYGYLQSLPVPSIDFLYLDGNHTNLPAGKGHRDSIENGRWLQTVFDLYISDPDPKPIRILDDMIKLILGGSGSKEGIGLNNYGIVVIETDGEIRKNDTLRSSEQNADRFVSRWSVTNHSLVNIAASQEFAKYHRLQRPTAMACLSCVDLQVCGGGMPTHRYSESNGYENPSVYCADQKYLIAHMREILSERLQGVDLDAIELRA